MTLRRIIQFKTEAEFIANRCLLPIPSVAYCADTGTIYFRKTSMLRVGHIVVYDSDADKEIYVWYTAYNAVSYPPARYIPTGVVVYEEQFAPDGHARAMSLVNMSSHTPETGKADNSGVDDGNVGYDIWLRYGGYSNINGEWIWADIPELVNFGEISNRQQVLVNPDGSKARGVSSWGYLPSDSYHSVFQDSEENNAVDAGTHWYNGIGTSPHLPSPFTTKMEHNPLYGSDKNGNQSTFLSDLNGAGNTQILLDRETYQPEWETDSQIINLQDGDFCNHHPAALCCARYHTAGTNAGDWYLPAIGELACIMPRFAIIQNALNAVRAVDESLAVPLDVSGFFWSSSEFSQNCAYGLGTYYGSVLGHCKDGSGCVRAFRSLPRI
ncbi:MAG: hypothetical protein IJ640_00295 [Prevotella sp.]|nr:hypothetical protein [Prevotella sp.]